MFTVCASYFQHIAFAPFHYHAQNRLQSWKDQIYDFSFISVQFHYLITVLEKKNREQVLERSACGTDVSWSEEVAKGVIQCERHKTWYT